MRVLAGKEVAIAQRFLNRCAVEAKKATCQRSKCGSVIVKDGLVIGKGYNSPPAQLSSQRRCTVDKASYDQKVTDKTCCVHAEQRAIMDALRTHPKALRGSQLYFLRIDNKDEPSFAGKPYCTICSKMALDVGIKEFVLMHAEGIKAYDTQEYNDLSYDYKNTGN